MKLSFLSHEQVYGGLLPVFEKVGTAAPASDLALLTIADDGFGNRSSLRLCGVITHNPI